MTEERTTIVLQQYLDGLAGESLAEPLVRSLLERAVKRLRLLCDNLLHRSYPRLTREPLNLQTDEMLSAVVERLLKALREARPQNVRQFFSLAAQHMRWELNDLARRLDKQPRAAGLDAEFIPANAASDSSLSPNATRMLQAIDDLPQAEREVFDLVRIQGMTHPEVAELVGVSEATVKRRLHRGLQLLADALGDLKPTSAH